VRRLYKASCDDGNTDSCNNLGMMLYKGEGGPKDGEGAKALFKRACDDGVQLGCKNLERK
jgi:TPR repeat protein